MDAEEHMKSLMKLKDTDPEFYSFLKQNDTKLLDFNVSDDNDDDNNDDGNSSDDEDNSRHVPQSKLEIASDESDYENEDDENYSGSRIKVTLKLITTWQEALKNDKYNYYIFF